jgi:hypothetical protein
VRPFFYLAISRVRLHLSRSSPRENAAVCIRDGRRIAERTMWADAVVIVPPFGQRFTCVGAYGADRTPLQARRGDTRSYNQRQNETSFHLLRCVRRIGSPHRTQLLGIESVHASGQEPIRSCEIRVAFQHSCQRDMPTSRDERQRFEIRDAGIKAE